MSSQENYLALNAHSEQLSLEDYCQDLDFKSDSTEHDEDKELSHGKSLRDWLVEVLTENKMLWRKLIAQQESEHCQQACKDLYDDLDVDLAPVAPRAVRDDSGSALEGLAGSSYVPSSLLPPAVPSDAAADAPSASRTTEPETLSIAMVAALEEHRTNDGSTPTSAYPMGVSATAKPPGGSTCLEKSDMHPLQNKNDVLALELKLGNTRSKLSKAYAVKEALEDELDNARRTIDDLQAQLTKSSDKSSGKPAALSETDELRGKVSELEAQLASARTDQLDLRESLVLARQESAKQEAQASVYMSRAMGLEDELSVCKAARDQLEEELEARNRVNSTVTEDNVALQDEVMNMRNALQELLSAAAGARLENDRLREQLAHSDHQFTTVRAEMEDCPGDGDGSSSSRLPNNEELRNEMQALERRLERSQQITSSARIELSAAYEAYEALEDELDNARQTIDDLQAQLTKSSDKSGIIQAIVMEADELRGKVSELEAQVSSARRDQLDLRESLVLARQESAKQEAQASVYMSRAMGLEDELSVCKAAKDELEQELVVTKESLLRCDQDKSLSVLTLTCQALNKELDGVRRSSTELETRLHTAQAAKSLIEDEATMLRAKVSELEEALVRKVTPMCTDQSAERCRALERELDCVRRSSTELETRLQTAQTAKSLIEDEATMLRSGLVDLEEALVRKVIDLEDALVRKESALSASELDNGVLGAHLVELRLSKTDCDQANELLRAQLSELRITATTTSLRSKEEVKDLRNTIQELEAQVSSARRDQLDLRESLVLARQESAKQEAQASVYMSRAMGLEDELSVCKTAKDELEEKLVVAKESLSSLSTLERQAAEEVIALKREVSELSETHVEKNKSLDALSQTVKDLQSKLASSSMENCRLLEKEKELQKARHELVELQDEYATLRAAKSSIEKELMSLMAKVADLEEALVHKVTALSTELNTERHSKTALELTVVQTKESNAILQQEAVGLRRDIGELGSIIDEVKCKNKGLKEQVFYTSKELKDTQKLLETTKRSLEDVTGEFYSFRLRTDQTMEDTSRTHQRRVDVMKDALDTMKLEMHTNRNSDAADLYGQLLAAQSKISDLTHHNNELLTENVQLGLEVKYLSECKKQLEEAEYQLAKTNDMLEESVSRADLLASEARCQDLERRLLSIGTASDDKVKVQKKSSIMESELVSLRLLVRDKEDLLLKSTKQTDELRKQLRDTEHLLRVSQDQVKYSQDRHAGSERSYVEQSRASIEKLPASKANSGSEYNDLRRRSEKTVDEITRANQLRLSELRGKPKP